MVDQKYNRERSFSTSTEIKESLWEEGERWTNEYYISTVSGRDDRRVIENYISKQGKTGRYNTTEII